VGRWTWLKEIIKNAGPGQKGASGKESLNPNKKSTTEREGMRSLASLSISWKDENQKDTPAKKDRKAATAP